MKLKTVDPSAMTALLGFVFGVVTSMLFIIYVDVDFDTKYKQMTHYNKLCEQLDSSPHSFDDDSVTCKNGTVLQPPVLSE